VTADEAFAVSANAMTHQVGEYLAAGMDLHVAKPIELPRPQAAMDKVMTLYAAGGPVAEAVEAA